MSAAAAVNRMLTLLPWLLERPGASLAETAAAFGTDIATIRRDLGHLDLCGLPGLGGGDLFEIEIVGERIVVRMADELSRPLRPSAREAYRLVLTLDAVAGALGDELPALRAAIAKVRATLGIPEQRADVVDEHDLQVLDAARAAVRSGRQVDLDYQGRGDTAPQRRRVDAWRLDVVDGAWYLQGYDHAARDRRAFRLDRARSLVVTDLASTTSVPDDLPPPRYVPGDDDLEVVLELGPAARWALDAIDVDEVIDRDDGSARCRLRTDAPMWIARLVLTGGGDIEVVAPLELRAQVQALAVRAIERP